MHTHTHQHTHIHSHILVHKHTDTHAHTLTHIPTITHAHLLAFTYTHIRSHTCTPTFTHANLLALTHTHIRSHSHTHTPTFTQTLSHTIIHTYTLTYTHKRYIISMPIIPKFVSSAQNPEFHIYTFSWSWILHLHFNKQRWDLTNNMSKTQFLSFPPSCVSYFPRASPGSAKGILSILHTKEFRSWTQLLPSHPHWFCKLFLQSDAGAKRHCPLQPLLCPLSCSKPPWSPG